MNCLWCDREIVLTLNWRNLFRYSDQENLCEVCEQTLNVIEGSRCQKCSRPSDVSTCQDCNYWEDRDDPLIFNYSVFSYNDAIKDMITKWKYRGDFILAEIFQATFHKAFVQKFSANVENTIIIPIPLSEERLNERGFNQAEVLASYLPIQMQNIMKRTHSEKQSKKSRVERLSAQNPFKLTKKVTKKVILVDDLYTTGTTLRHAATLLQEMGSPEIYAYTLVRG